jgi:small subunit ribosomal protein S18
MADKKGNRKFNNRNNNNDDDSMPRQRRIKKKVCAFCADKNLVIDYKDSDKLKKYVSEKGKILPRRVTGLCAKHQREMTLAVKRARHIALLPYTAE